MRKKLLAMMLVSSMAIGLAGCGGGNNTSTKNKGDVKISNDTEEVELHGITYTKAKDLTEDNIEITYFHFDQNETVNYLADRFMEIYPNIKVTPVYNEVKTYNETLLTLINNGDSPDIIMYSDADFALSNLLLADITDLWNSDPETKEIADTINDCNLGCFGTSKRFAVPVKFFPTAMLVDRNVLKKLNVKEPSRDWKWDDMIQLIKDCTVSGIDNRDYYGCGFYNRLDSYYGIASSQDVVGEFGFNGTEFNLAAWAIGEQQFADLKLGGYIAPEKDTIQMEQWMGDFQGWCGASSHVALFTEAFWTYQGTFATEGWEQYKMDIVPYVVPAVSEEDAGADHHSIATIDFGGLTPACEYPREAYEVLKFMSFGKDGWKTRIQLYNDEEQKNASGLALKYDVMPCPITKDDDIWSQYIDMYCKGMDDEHLGYWKEYFASCLQPIPYGWTSIAGYWNYCDEYFNKIDIHKKVDSGEEKAADYVDDATRKANYYHAVAMLQYFGERGYDVLTDEETALYQKMEEENQG